MVCEVKTMFRILICDDDTDILRALSIYLSAEGYETLSAENGEAALEIAAHNEIHLAIIDVMMPKLDGIATTSALRKTHNFPIILLTAKSEDGDKVLGLTIGADDYVTKPFVPIELIARVKSQLRRYALLGGMQKTGSAETHIMRVGGIELDDEQKRVTLDGLEVALTPTEYAILLLLMSNPNKVFSTRKIYEAVWNESAHDTENLVAVHVRHLREKLEITPAEPRYIKVVWGQGYKLESGK